MKKSTTKLHYKIFDIYLNFEICKAKQNYYFNKFKGIVDSKKTWQAIREMGHGQYYLIIK